MITILARDDRTAAVDNYSSQKDKALPVKTSKPNFVTFFMYFRK